MSSKPSPLEEVPLRILHNPGHPFNNIKVVVLRPTTKPTTFSSVLAAIKSFFLSLFGVPVLGWEVDVAEIATEATEDVTETSP